MAARPVSVLKSAATAIKRSSLAIRRRGGRRGSRSVARTGVGSPGRSRVIPASRIEEVTYRVGRSFRECARAPCRPRALVPAGRSRRPHRRVPSSSACASVRARDARIRPSTNRCLRSRSGHSSSASAPVEWSSPPTWSAPPGSRYHCLYTGSRLWASRTLSAHSVATEASARRVRNVPTASAASVTPRTCRDSSIPFRTRELTRLRRSQRATVVIVGTPRRSRPSPSTSVPRV